ncbi:Glucan endo-1 [Psidium guajava]|nr:Glucan endo-1 [Psidium guajava]
MDPIRLSAKERLKKAKKKLREGLLQPKAKEIVPVKKTLSSDMGNVRPSEPNPIPRPPQSFGGPKGVLRPRSDDHGFRIRKFPNIVVMEFQFDLLSCAFSVNQFRSPGVASGGGAPKLVQLLLPQGFLTTSFRKTSVRIRPLRFNPTWPGLWPKLGPFRIRVVTVVS